jgi:hypothetical protein
MRPWRAAIVLGGALTMAVPALAHGFLVSVRGEGSAITGRVYYSDGAPGAGEFVELRDLTDGAQTVRSGTTDTAGNFRFDGVAGHRYALIAHGEEGHTTEMEITLGAGERGRLVDAPRTSGIVMAAAGMGGDRCGPAAVDAAGTVAPAARTGWSVMPAARRGSIKISGSGAGARLSPAGSLQPCGMWNWF